jgi:hypothetical protein
MLHKRRLAERAFRAARPTRGRMLPVRAPLHFHYEADPGACGNTLVMPHNRQFVRPNPRKGVTEWSTRW